MMQSDEKRVVTRSIFPVLMCILLGGIAITLSSKNSFLYEFNDSGDIQVFVNTARCMLRGDVLYRDIFEVKGPYLYFLYMLGLIIDGDSFLGIFLLETILFIVFLFLTYKIAALYLENMGLRLFAVAVAAFVSTTTYVMFGGGQCEELLLPFFAAAIYIVVKYFRQQYPSRICGWQVVLTGLLASVILWTKYTLLGLFLGVVFYLAYLQIKNKRIKELWIYIGEFLCGLLIGTIPILIYFIKNNALADLFEVYFYNLIFCYKSVNDQTFNIFNNKFYLYYIGASALTAFALFYPIVDVRERMNRQEKKVIIWMIVMQAVGISCSRHWGYTAQCMHAFSGLGAVCVLLAVKDCLAGGKELLKKMAQAVHKFLEEKPYQQWYFFPLLIALVLLMNTKVFILPVVAVVGSVILTQVTRFLYGKVSNEMKAGKKLFLLKYILLMLVYYVVRNIGMDAIDITKDMEQSVTFYLFVMTILLVALDDYCCHEGEIDATAVKLLHQWKEEYQAGAVKINILVSCLGIVLFGLYCHLYSKSTYDIGTELENKPQYILAEYINNSGIEDPVIINYKNIDKGVYWLTGTYPPTKYSCGYNMDFSELNAMYEEYIDGKKADFIVVEDERYTFEGYREVYCGRDFYINTKLNCTLILLEREQE